MGALPGFFVIVCFSSVCYIMLSFLLSKERKKEYRVGGREVSRI